MDVSFRCHCFRQCTAGAVGWGLPPTAVVPVLVRVPGAMGRGGGVVLPLAVSVMSRVPGSPMGGSAVSLVSGLRGGAAELLSIIPLTVMDITFITLLSRELCT